MIEYSHTNNQWETCRMQFARMVGSEIERLSQRGTKWRPVASRRGNTGRRSREAVRWWIRNRTFPGLGVVPFRDRRELRGFLSQAGTCRPFLRENNSRLAVTLHIAARVDKSRIAWFLRARIQRFQPFNADVPSSRPSKFGADKSLLPTLNNLWTLRSLSLLSLRNSNLKFDESQAPRILGLVSKFLPWIFIERSLTHERSCANDDKTSETVIIRTSRVSIDDLVNLYFEMLLFSKLCLYFLKTFD